jgi:hypothetical protein
VRKRKILLDVDDEVENSSGEHFSLIAGGMFASINNFSASHEALRTVGTERQRAEQTPIVQCQW